jgi:RimJ/RimL family protein N-acetyltransferase
MQDPFLLEATGSEPLSLEQEYEMQRQWRDDDEKCTFIIMVHTKTPGCILGDASGEEDNGPHAGSGASMVEEEVDWIQKSLSAMVGDVNIFLSPEENDTTDDEDHGITVVADDDDDDDNNKTCPYYQAELDIMVADQKYRGRGIGREASLMMMLYAAKHMHIRRFFCKINQENEASLRLFRDKLGFYPCAYAECFQQVELEFKTDTREQMIQRIETLLGRCTLTIVHCPIIHRTESIEQNTTNNSIDDDDKECVMPIRTELLEEQPCTDE